MSTVGAISSNTKNYGNWGKIARLLNTPIVDVGNSKGLAAVAKTTVKCPANIVSLFSSVMFAITGVNLLSKLNDFSSGTLWEKTKLLFVPVVSGITTLLPHVITGLFSDNNVKSVDEKVIKLTDRVKSEILPTYIKSIPLSHPMSKINTIMSNVLEALEITTHEVGLEETCRNEYLLSTYRHPVTGTKYLQTLHHDANNNLYVNRPDGFSEDIVYGFRFTVEEGKKEEDGQIILDITYLAKKVHEDDSCFMAIGREVKELHDVFTNDFLDLITGDSTVSFRIQTILEAFNLPEVSAEQRLVIPFQRYERI